VASSKLATMCSLVQPSREQLKAMRNAGIRNIISLRPESELDWSERASVAEVGVTYYSIPVDGVSGVTEKNSVSFQSILSGIGNEPVLVHCSSGNRVGALIATTEYKIENRSLDASMDEGKRWRPNRLEPKLRLLLTNADPKGSQ